MPVECLPLLRNLQINIHTNAIILWEVSSYKAFLEKVSQEVITINWGKFIIIRRLIVIGCRHLFLPALIQIRWFIWVICSEVRVFQLKQRAIIKIITTIPFSPTNILKNVWNEFILRENQQLCNWKKNFTLNISFKLCCWVSYFFFSFY